MRLYQRHISVNGVLQHVVPAADLAGLLARGELGAVARRGEDGAKARACRLDARGEIALRHEF